MAGLLWFQGGHRAQEHPCAHGGAIYSEGLLKWGTSDDVHRVITTACTIYRMFDLPYFMSCPRQCLNSNIKRHSLGPCLQSMLVKGDVTKTINLSNKHAGAYRCRKVSHSLRMISLLHIYLLVFNFITTCKRSLRRLCFYRCLSVHRGDYLGRYPPARYTPSPLAGTPPWAGTHHRTGTLTGQVHSLEQVPPRPQCMLGYGQQAGSTHSTGMHSRFELVFCIQTICT